MPTYENSEIILNEKEAEKFAQALQHPDEEQLRKRDEALKEIEKGLKYQIDKLGNVQIDINNLNDFNR